jgi:RNA polymerase sigma-70 factor (ECF subfamily)
MSQEKELKNLTDEEIVELFLLGNERYFKFLTIRYEKYIFQKCMGYVKDTDVASDLLQEILIKVFLNLGQFHKKAKFSTWLFSIIHHTCIDYLRKNKKNVHGVITEKLADEIGEILDGNESPEEEKTIEMLNELLETMTPEEKLILVLKYKERHTIRDIQYSLNLSESAVKMRLLRAKEHLNNLYREKYK